MGAAVAQRALVGVLEQVELGLAADERRLERLQGPRPAGAVGAERAPRPHGRGETLHLDRAEVLDLDAAQRQPVRARTEEQLPGLRGLLEPCRERDRLAGGERRIAVLDDHFARLDAHARLELELLDRVEDREPGANGALGVVLVRLWDAEGGHDRVAGKLLDDPAVRDHAVRDAVEERLDTPPHDLRIGARNERGRVDEVDEQDRGKLAFHSSSVRTIGPGRNFRGPA